MPRSRHRRDRVFFGRNSRTSVKAMPKMKGIRPMHRENKNPRSLALSRVSALSRNCSWCRGPDSNRQANQGGGFSSHCFFQSRRRMTRRRSCAGLCLRRRARADPACPCALGAPRLVSTPSTRAPHSVRCEAWLGVASMHGIRGFTEFEGFCTGRFRPGTQLFKSAMSTNFITPARADGILPLVTPALATDFTVTGNGQRNALFIRGRHDGRLPARPAVLSGLDRKSVV